MSTHESADHFNAGDRVFVTSYGTIEKAVIARVTKTQAIIGRGHYEQRFRRDTGYLIGGSGYSLTCIERPTPALDKQWREKRARQAALALADAARAGEERGIREAFARWDRWATARAERESGSS